MDESNYTREKQKRLLKKNIIQPGSPVIKEPPEDANNIRSRKIRKVMVRAGIAAAVLFCIFFAWNRFWGDRVYETYEELWNTEMPEGSLYGYASFGDNVIKYSRDGASYIDASGKVVWNNTYQMKEPEVSVNGNYVAIGDLNGNNVIICNKETSIGSYSTQAPISSLSIAANGVTVVVMEDAMGSYTQYYDSAGNMLEIEVKSVLYQDDGYPLDISISPNGTQMMQSYVYLDKGLMQNKVVFRNFSDKGKSEADRVVGLFFFENTLIPRVKFITEELACAFGDNQLLFFSLRNELSPEATKTVEISGEVKSVFYNSSHVGYITDNVEGEEQYRLFVYTASGSLEFEQAFSFDFTKVELGDKNVILYNANECMIYGMSGLLKFRQTFDFDIMKIVEHHLPGQFIISGSTQMRGIRLK